MCTGSERKFLYIQPVSQKKKCSSADLPSVASTNSSWIFVRLHAPTAAEIDPVMALLIRKAESIGHIVGDQWEWEIN